MSAPTTDWLSGTPMDPAATPAEPLPHVPGLPFAYRGASGVIVGETGGGRSALVQACLYDAAKAGQRCAYLGGEITHEEFDARAAVIAERRGDSIDEALRAELAAVRYLDLASTIEGAWRKPQEWIEGVVASYEIVGIDPLSAVASALDLKFDNSNDDYVRAFDRLIRPLTMRGVTVAIVENIGHDPDAKRRAKGASAKGDRTDLAFSCSPSVNPVGLIIRAQKVRSVRAPFRRGDEWLFERDTQRIRSCERVEAGEQPGDPFRPTALMQKISRLVERDPGLSRNAILTTVGGRKEWAATALELLVNEGYIEVRKDGQAHCHHSLRPYRKPTGSQPGPNRVPDPVQAAGSHRVPHPVGVGPVTGPGAVGPASGPTGSQPAADSLSDAVSADLDNGHRALTTAVRALADMDEDAAEAEWERLVEKFGRPE